MRRKRARGSPPREALEPAIHVGLVVRLLPGLAPPETSARLAPGLSSEGRPLVRPQRGSPPGAGVGVDSLVGAHHRELAGALGAVDHLPDDRIGVGARGGEANGHPSQLLPTQLGPKGRPVEDDRGASSPGPTELRDPTEHLAAPVAADRRASPGSEQVVAVDEVGQARLPLPRSRRGASGVSLGA